MSPAIRMKYPRTWHLPWSPGQSKGDDVHRDDGIFRDRRVVATLKMDGENTTWYRDYMHARSTEYSPHPSRERVKALHASVCSKIPYGWRVVGENMYARHSIPYADLAGFFLIHSVWDGALCLSWGETERFAQTLGLPTVPRIYFGLYNRQMIEKAWAPHVNAHEGYVVRRVAAFQVDEFRQSVAKYVRAGHVQTDKHWMREPVIRNGLVTDTRAVR